MFSFQLLLVSRGVVGCFFFSTAACVPWYGTTSYILEGWFGFQLLLVSRGVSGRVIFVFNCCLCPLVWLKICFCLRLLLVSRVSRGMIGRVVFVSTAACVPVVC